MSLQHTATLCNTLQHTATHCKTLQHTATHYHTDTGPFYCAHTATHCNTIQNTATYCITGFMLTSAHVVRIVAEFRQDWGGVCKYVCLCACVCVRWFMCVCPSLSDPSGPRRYVCVCKTNICIYIIHKIHTTQLMMSDWDDYLCVRL